MNNLSRQVLRFGFALLFLWFGYQHILDPSVWLGFLPEWTGYLPIPGETLVQINGLFAIISALFLILGVYTRVVALILGFHLIAIALEAGGATGVRDAALAMCALALASSEPDKWTVDFKHNQKKLQKQQETSINA